MCRRSRPSMISVRCASSSLRARASCGVAASFDVSSRTIARASSRSSVGDSGFGSRAQLLDRGKAVEPDDLLRADHQQRKPGQGREREAERAEPFRAPVEVFDQRGRGEADGERDKAAERGPEHRAPRKACASPEAAASPAPADRNSPAPGSTRTVPRARVFSSSGATMTCGSSRRKAAGRRLMRVGLRAGIAAHGRGGCGAAPARPTGSARTAAGGSAGSGSRSHPSR